MMDDESYTLITVISTGEVEIFLWSCCECGGLVVDRDKHTFWHVNGNRTLSALSKE